MLFSVSNKGKNYETSSELTYPFVAHIDGTNSTNKGSRPLVTVTGRDALGIQFTALRTFFPNNQAWVFKLLFQTVFPTLVGIDALARIVVFITEITDGDSQETCFLKLYESAIFGMP